MEDLCRKEYRPVTDGFKLCIFVNIKQKIILIFVEYIQNSIKDSLTVCMATKYIRRLI